MRSKYRAIPTTVHGFRFASRAESRRYQELLLLGLSGGRSAAIRNLELQPRFPLLVDGTQIGVYVADFRYEEWQWDEGGMSGRWVDVVEDVKGCVTPMFRMKQKHMAAQYGLRIQEVRMR